MNKEYHLTKSKTFCMIPWVHLHTSPLGVAAPCCISESASTVNGMGNAKTQSFMELVNSEKMKQLRVDMVNEVSNAECTKCYDQEQVDVKSFRQDTNSKYNDYYEEALSNTTSEGEVTQFKMKYFDIRFSNICNFKCRSCGSEFSTQWEQEDIKSKVSYARIIPKNDNPKFLQEVVDQIQFMDTAYFAGGEPLITEEHYILLEEMIKQKRTDIQLRYNTNLSNLKFKDKDLLSLWKHFQHRIQVSASIDHYGERAEYIRHGTNWSTVEENFAAVKKTPYVNLTMNTVLSVFNLLTIHEFYQYLIDKHLYIPTDHVYSMYNMSDPVHLSGHILPDEYKLKGKESLEKYIKILNDNKFKDKHLTQPEQSLNWLFSKNTWEEQKDKFRSEIKRLDNLRGEDFSKTFPELAGLL
jgi:MoaA/NifB/PqqE/SkfB family radical SAM enzyme